MEIREIIEKIAEEKKNAGELRVLSGWQQEDLMEATIRRSTLWIARQRRFVPKCLQVMNSYMQRQNS